MNVIRLSTGTATNPGEKGGDIDYCTGQLQQIIMITESDITSQNNLKDCNKEQCFESNNCRGICWLSSVAKVITKMIL